MPHATAIAIVNITTVTSVATSLKRGVPAGASATISGVAQRANSNPSIAPADDSTRPSTITCCSSRDRFAPRAARSASSRCRATPRASIRLATFTQAIEQHHADAAEQQQHRRAHWRHRLLMQRHHVRRPAAVGLGIGLRELAPRMSRSACASSIDTPSFTLATTACMRAPRSVAPGLGSSKESRSRRRRTPRS